MASDDEERAKWWVQAFGLGPEPSIEPPRSVGKGGLIVVAIAILGIILVGLLRTSSVSDLLSDLGTAALVAGSMFVGLLVIRLPAVAVAAARHLSRPRRIPRAAIVLSLLVGLMAFTGARGYRDCTFDADTCAWANLGWAMGLPFLVIIYGAAALLVALVVPKEEDQGAE